jgi:phosphoribosyl-AMP cyclohydrolase
VNIDQLQFDGQGLICAVVVDDESGDVLMVAWMNSDTLAETLETGRMVYWSRSRQERWRKGDTSGDVQHVRSAALDCDGDALLFRVEQVGVACHTGERSCFHRPLAFEPVD